MNDLKRAHPEIPKLSAHCLRHVRASLWIAGGMAPYMAAKLLGHTDLKMLLKIYDHTDVDTLRKALEKIENSMSCMKIPPTCFVETGRGLLLYDLFFCRNAK